MGLSLAIFVPYMKSADMLFCSGGEAMATKPGILFLAVIAAVIVASVVAFIFVSNGQIISRACDDGGVSVDNTIKFLDGIVDLGLKLSTAMIAFSVALLLGFKGGVSLTPAVRASLLIASLFFCQSAFYGVWWRFELANIWLNQCSNWIVQPLMQRRYQAHLGFFVIGVFSLGVLIVVAALNPSEGALTEDKVGTK